MTCTFCGSGNRLENRFCGMCGVRLERRQMERRSGQSGNIKCADCNHVNEPGHKFCGMCGAKTERRVQERRGSAVSARTSANDISGRAVAQANARLPSPEMVAASADSARGRVAAPAPAVLNQMERAEPVAVVRNYHPNGSISGPSFLGLNSEPQSEGEYLLEDESSSRSGLRKLVLLAVLLAIAGLIFVQWRASYNANPKPLEPPRPEPATVPRPQSKNQPPLANTQEKEQARNSMTGNASDRDGQTLESDTQAAQTKNSGPTRNAGPTAPASEVAAPGQPQEKPVPRGAIPTRSLAADARNQDSKAQDTSDEAQSQSERARGAPAKRERPSPVLVKAQRYLQGRGVPQNCEQGMMYLKAATQQNDPNAAVQMAALYASGHCVQQDRAKAYQWFSSANSLEPGNQWIAKNMNQLWGQMTLRERRQFQ